MALSTILRSPWTAAATGALFGGLTAVAAGERAPELLAIMTGAGLALGVFLHQVVRSVAVLLGQSSLAGTASAAAMARLERDKRVLLRSIKDIEFDVQLARVSEQEGQELVAPLKGRAMRLLKELDHARAGALDAPSDRDTAIEEAIAARIAALAEPSSEAVEPNGATEAPQDEPPIAGDEDNHEEPVEQAATASDEDEGEAPKVVTT